jgi:hypothetical protein
MKFDLFAAHRALDRFVIRFWAGVGIVFLYVEVYGRYAIWQVRKAIAWLRGGA